MKKRIFSIMLALMLCFGVAEGVQASEAAPVEETGLPTPSPSWTTDCESGWVWYWM